MSKLTDSDTENAKIFPHLLLTHKDDTKEYLWFDYLIADGDTFKSNKFVAYDFVESKDTTYFSKFMQSVNNQIKSGLEGGFPISAVLKMLPSYMLAENVGTDKEYKSVTASDGTWKGVDEEDVKNCAYELAAKKANDIAKGFLDKYGIEMKDVTVEDIKPATAV